MAYSLRDIIKQKVGEFATGKTLIRSPRKDTSYIEHTITQGCTRLFIEWIGADKESWSSGLVKIKFHTLYDQEDPYGYLNAHITRVNLAEPSEHLAEFYRLRIRYFAKGVWEENKVNSREGLIVQKYFSTLLEAMEFAETCLTYEVVLMYMDSYI